MMTQLIVGTLILLAIVFLGRSSSYSEEEQIPDFDIPTEKTNRGIQKETTLPQKFRRWQQSLIKRERQSEEREFYNTFKERELSLEQRGVVLGQHELKLIDLANQLASNQRNFDVDKQEHLIELNGRELKLNELLQQIQHRENVLSLSQQELRLDGKKIELEEMLTKIILEGRSVELDKKELANQRREMQQEFKELEFGLTTLLQKIFFTIQDFELNKKAWSIQVAQDKLDLYHQQIKQMEYHFAKLFSIRMEELKLKERENSVSYRENRLDLQRLYNDTQNKLARLQVSRNEINNHWDKRDLQHRKMVFNDLRQMWLGRG